MFRREYTVMLVLVALMAMLGGCRLGGGEASSQEGGKRSYTVMLSEHPNQPIQPDAPSFQWREELTGVKLQIEAIPADNYEGKKKTLISTKHLPDMMFVSHTDVVAYADKGVFLPITDYLEHAPNLQRLMERYPESERLKVNGKLYSLPIMARYQNEAGPFPMIRADLLEKLGLELPTSFGELRDVLRAFKQAYPESHPMTSRWGTEQLLTVTAYPLGSGYDVYYDYDVNGGVWLYGPSQPAFKDVLAYLNELYEEGLLDPDYAVSTSQSWADKLSRGKSMFYYDNNGFASQFGRKLRQSSPDARFEMIPLLANDRGQSRNYKYPPHFMDQSFVISAQAQQPEEIVRYMDWMYSEEGADVTNFGVLGEHFSKRNEQYVMADSLLERYKDSISSYPMQSDMGTGLLAFTLYVDERANHAFHFQDYKEWSKLIRATETAQPGSIVYKPLPPPLTGEEAKRAGMLRASLNAMILQEADFFIMGVKPLEEYDALIQHFIQEGARELEHIYNSAQQRLPR